jgi:hypothetical protein
MNGAGLMTALRRDSMLRTFLSVFILTLLSGCISFSSSESSSGPDYMAFCQDKEAQCKQVCGDVGVQNFSCRAAPREGLEYKCECKKPLGKSI